MTERFVNYTARTTLNGAINNSQTTLVINSVLDSPPQPTFRIRIGNEILLVTQVADTVNYTVGRGAEGTAAAAHANGAVVHYIVSAGALQAVYDATTFTQYGLDAVTRPSAAKLRDLEVSPTDFDLALIGDGSADLIPGLQKAITTLGTGGGRINIPRGDWLFGSQPDISGIRYLTLRGHGEGTVLWAKDLTDYCFSYDGLDGKSFAMEDLVLDGRNGAPPAHANNSDTWRGVITVNGSVGGANIFMRRVRAFGSNALYPMFDLRKGFFYQFDECRLGNWELHLILKIAGAGGFTGTTASFKKCYFNYSRQVYDIAAQQSDIQFTDNCVFESCVAAGAQHESNLLHQGSHFENIGYDVSGTGLTTGVSLRSLGIGDSPEISGNVSSAITQRYGQSTYQTCRFAYLMPSGPLTSWIDGIGRGGPSAGGVLKLINPSFTNVDGVDLFRADSDSPSSRGDFEYHYEAGSDYRSYLRYSDARMVTKGRFKMPFSDGGRRVIEVSNGSFRTPTDAINGFSALPHVYPDGGQWKYGDIVERVFSAQAAAKERSWICVADGTAGTWESWEFTPSSKTAVVAPSGFMDFGGVMDILEGVTHVWEVIGTDNNARISYRATAALARLPNDRGLDVHESIELGTNTVTLQTNADVYTLRVTNGNAFSMIYYARLLRAYRSHL